MVLKKSEIKLNEEERAYLVRVETLIDNRLREAFGGSDPESECWVTSATIKEETGLPASMIIETVDWVKANYTAAGWKVSFEYPIESDEGGYFIFK